MFGGKNKYRNVRIDTLVGRNTELTGDVAFKGGLHVDGKINGNVTTVDDPEAVVTVSVHGTIEGEIRVPFVIVDGRVNGDVYASERVELASNARVKGSVYYHMLEMAAGAEINGKLVHQPGGPKLLELHHSDKDKGKDKGKADTGTGGN